MEAQTASEQIITGLRESWQALLRLSPEALALNIGLSLLLIAAAAGLAYLGRRLLKRGAEATPGPDNAEKIARTRRVVTVTRTAFDVGLVLGTFFLLARIWGFDLSAGCRRGLASRWCKAGCGSPSWR